MTEFPIYFTGIRPGETIISNGHSKQNEGSEIIVWGSYPPSKSALNNLNKQEWDNLLEFIGEENQEKTKTRLLDSAIDNDDLYLDDLELFINPINLTGNLFDTSLTEEQKNKFLQPNPDDENGRWPLDTVYKAIKPAKLGNKPKHHTLVFRPSIWKIKRDEGKPIVRKYNGVYFSFNSLTMKEGRVNNILFPKNIDIAIEIDKGDSCKIDELFEIIRNLLGSSPESLEAIYKEISWTPPSFHKSLIQKIIRTRARSIVFYNGDTYDAAEVLLVSFVTLFLHPGAFVPALQTFVTGAEGALKRLAVSICEDSWVSDGDKLLSLYLGAYLAKNYRTDFRNWFGSFVLTSWMELALEAFRSKLLFDYSTKSIAPLENKDSWYLCYFMLDTLKSFKTDINMLSWIASNEGKPRARNNEKIKRIKELPIAHFIDQHLWPELAYFCHPSMINDDEVDFSGLFGRIWDYSSGINPRSHIYLKTNFGLDETRNLFLIKLRKAQWLVWAYKAPVSLVRSLEFKLTGETINTGVQHLEDSWIAGLIGPVRISPNMVKKTISRSFYVSVDPNDVSQRKVMIFPVRNKKIMEKPISDEERILAIGAFNNLLIDGLPTINLSTMPWFKGSIIYCNLESYSIKLKGRDKKIPWKKARRISANLDVIEPIKVNIKNSILTRSRNDILPIVKGGEERVYQIIDNLEPDLLSRLITFLTGNSGVITMPQISRDGDGVTYMVRPIDVRIYRLFCHFSCLIPSVITVSPQNQGFKVRYYPFFIKLKEYVLNASSENIVFNRWRRLYAYWNKEGRKLKSHQSDSVTLMLNSSFRGHVIDIPAGGGKTAIVGEYLRIMNKRKELPPYVIYTLPPSAIAGVREQLEYFGFIVNLVDGRNNIKSNNIKFEKHQINLIRHDHLRNKSLISQLRLLIGKAVFIVDEFHLTLNPTQRTTIALELARNSYKFIALSGTPIKDSNTNYLIPWLEPIVSFEVNEKNFWTAVAGMLSGRMELPIKVVHHKIEVPLLPAEEIKMKRLLELNDSDGFNMCFEACIDEMVNLTKEKVKGGHRVLIVAKNKFDQDIIYNKLISGPISLLKSSLFIFDGDHPITLEYDDKGPIEVVITTYRHVTGYTLTKMDTLITSVYFCDETVRRQLIGRLVRLSQKSPRVDIYTFYAGILGEILRRYEMVGSMAIAQKSMANEINM